VNIENKLTNEVDSLTHFLKFIRTNVGTVGKAEIEQNPLAMIIRTLPCNASVINEIPRTSNSSLAKCSRPLFFNYYQSQTSFTQPAITTLYVLQYCIVLESCF